MLRLGQDVTRHMRKDCALWYVNFGNQTFTGKWKSLRVFQGNVSDVNWITWNKLTISIMDFLLFVGNIIKSGMRFKEILIYDNPIFLNRASLLSKYLAKVDLQMNHDMVAYSDRLDQMGRIASESWFLHCCICFQQFRHFELIPKCICFAVKLGYNEHWHRVKTLQNTLKLLHKNIILIGLNNF